MKLMLNLRQKLSALCETEMIQAIQVQEKHAREDAIKEVKEKYSLNMKNKKLMMTSLKQVKANFR